MDVMRWTIEDREAIAQLAKDVVGMSEYDAHGHLGDRGFQFRTVSYDGVGVMKTNDAPCDRVSMDVVGDVVTKAWIG
jgi:hypothetical protein